MGTDFESSAVGKALISLLMLVLLGSLVLWNLPEGKPRKEARDVVGKVLMPVGLDQDWSVFAPAPRTFTVGFRATVTYEDGSTRTWRPPEVGKVIAPYRTYRWQKYDERIRADDFEPYWNEAAEFIARETGPHVVKVVLLRDFQPAVVPGSGRARPANQTIPFYTWTRP